MDSEKGRQYDVCCVGNWSGFNYGAHLTHYALYKTLKNEGYKVLMLEKPNVEPFLPLSRPELFKENPYSEDALSKIYDSLEDMVKLNDICRIFVVGSDQLWNYDLFGHSMEFYGLAFVNGNNKMISYATSLGAVPFKMPENKKNMMRILLQRFDAISVRESDGVEFCNKMFGINAEHVLDPVFLCDTESYIDLAKKSNYFSDDKFNESYIFSYIIHPTKEKIEFINELSKRKNMNVVCIGDALYSDRNFYGLEKVTEAKVEDWLALLYRSRYVVADSFHAYCFSIIFEKNIFPIYNFRSNRVNSLSEVLGTVEPIYLSSYKDRIQELLNKLEEKGFCVSYGKLKKEIMKSRKWLLNSVECPKKKVQDTVNDILVFQSLTLHNHNNQLKIQMNIINEQKKLIEEQTKIIQQLNCNIEEYRVELMNRQKEMFIKNKMEILKLIGNMGEQQL